MSFIRGNIPVVLFLLVFGAVLAVPGNTRKSDVAAFRVADIHTSSSQELGLIKRGNAPFEFLFVNHSDRPVFIDVSARDSRLKSNSSLWLFASQANNHCELKITQGGALIGTVQNKISIPLPEPIVKLSYVGELQELKSKQNLTIELGNKDPGFFYAELGLLIAAPKGMSETEIMRTLFQPQGGYLDGFVIPFSIVLLGIIALSFSAREARKGVTIARILIVCSCCAFVVLIQFFSRPQASLNPLAGRSPFDITFDSVVTNGITNLDKLQRLVLTSKEKVGPIYNGPLEADQNTLTTHIYQTQASSHYESVYDSLLWGQIRAIQSISPDKFVIFALVSVGAMLVAIVLPPKNLARWQPWPCLLFISAFSIFLSIRLSEGYDEFFINLRHSYMLSNHWVFSINAKGMQEATVDFLPLFLTGLSAKIGSKLPDALLIICLAGNAVLVFASFVFVRKTTESIKWALIVSLLVGIYPNVLKVGGTGFAAVLFTGCLILTAYLLLFPGKRKLGLLFAGSLTLLRTEGILFGVLILTYVWLIEIVSDDSWYTALTSHFKRRCVEFAVVLVPFVLSCGVRMAAFGHLLPTPVSFKNTGFDTAYCSAGLSSFENMVLQNDLHFLVVAIIGMFLIGLFSRRTQEGTKTGSTQASMLVGLCCVFVLFVTPYFSGGGDWFPATMNRYGLPLNIVILLTASVLFYRMISNSSLGRFGFIVAFSGITLLGASYLNAIRHNQKNSVHTVLDDMVGDRSQSWGRIDRLSSLGQFLKANLPADAVIASPEEATIMYYSEHEMLGLLGVSNPAIASMPLQPMNSGDILHRKRAVESVTKERPDIIALYEPVIQTSFPINPSDPEELTAGIKRLFFNDHVGTIAYYRVGSYKHLISLGYQHFTVIQGDRVFSFFTSSRIKDYLSGRLKSSAYADLGAHVLTGDVSEDTVRRFHFSNY